MSSANFFGLTKGTLAPYFFEIEAISSSSVVTIISSHTPDALACSIV